MTYWTFVAICGNAEHIVMTGVSRNIDDANKCLHFSVQSMLKDRYKYINRFWYALGDGHEAQEYTPEEVAVVFFGQ